MASQSWCAQGRPPTACERDPVLAAQCNTARLTGNQLSYRRLQQTPSSETLAVASSQASLLDGTGQPCWANSDGGNQCGASVRRLLRR